MFDRLPSEILSLFNIKISAGPGSLSYGLWFVTSIVFFIITYYLSTDKIKNSSLEKNIALDNLIPHNWVTLELLNRIKLISNI